MVKKRGKDRIRTSIHVGLRLGGPLAAAVDAEVARLNTEKPEWQHTRSSTIRGLILEALEGRNRT